MEKEQAGEVVNGSARVPFARDRAVIVAASVALVLVACCALEASPALRSGAKFLSSLVAWCTIGGALAVMAFEPRQLDVWIQHLAPHALLLIILAFVLALYGAWSDATSDGYRIAGTLPYSDSADYYSGAERLLAGGGLDSWNSRRPLNAVLLAVRLALAGRHYRYALLLQALLLAWAVYMAARNAATRLGWPVGALMVGSVLVFARPFLATSLSESLGLTLGSLAFVLLVSAAREPRPWCVAAGFAAFTFALQARAGVMFAMPLLLLWALFALASPWGIRIRMLGFAIVGVAASVAMNAAVALANGAERGASQSNFAYTLYGLAKGGTLYSSAIEDYPQIRHLSDAETGRLLYARSFELIREHPFDLVKGLAVGMNEFVQAITGREFGGNVSDIGHRQLFVGHGWVAWLLVSGAIAATAWRVRGRMGAIIEGRTLWMFHAVVLGVLLSVPVIFADGGRRVFAPAIPFLAAYAGVVFRAFVSKAASVSIVDDGPPLAVHAAAVTIGLAACAIAGPFLAHVMVVPHGDATVSAGLCATLPGGGVIVHEHSPELRLVEQPSDESAPETLTAATATAHIDRHFFVPPLAAMLRSLSVGDRLVVGRTKDAKIVYLKGRGESAEALCEGASVVDAGGIWVVQAL